MADAAESAENPMCVYQPAPPCGIVLFGASGDLAHRKIIPALFDLMHQRLLPPQWFLLGVATTPMTDEQFRQDVEQTLRAAGKATLRSAAWAPYLARCHYLAGDLTKAATYATLVGRVTELEGRYRTGGNRVIHLAMSPMFYPTIAHEVARSGLAHRSGTQAPWSRIIVEKPLGHDVASAQALNRELRQHVGEDQLYRIDHYLGKETVQNLLVFRCANTIFEPIWNRRFIDQVQITVAETVGVEHRAAYYDQTGCVRDMFQNHLMQLVCLTAMEPPSRMEAGAIHDEKVNVLRALRPLPLDRLAEVAVRGQYQAGTINEARVSGYLDEPGIPRSSTTETFAALKLFIENERWRGVPFALRSGKRMARRMSEIVIRFAPVSHMMFDSLPPGSLRPNVLTLRLQPDEGIGVSFEAKQPGPQLCMSSVTMDFSYQQTFHVTLPGPYEHLLLECMLGNQMLFAREDWVEASWAFFTPLVEAWRTGPPPEPYEAGTSVPPEAHEAPGPRD